MTVHMQAEARRTEILIGQLLGPAEIGANQHNGAHKTFRALTDPYRSAFRFFAANAEQAERFIANGITRRSPLNPGKNVS